MHVSHPAPLQTRGLGGGQTVHSVPARRGRQIGHLERRVKGQQGVRDPRVEFRQELCYPFHLGCVHISRHEQGRGDQKRRVRPAACPTAQVAEVVQGPAVRRAAQRAMQRLIPRLQIELDRAAAFQRQLGHLFQCRAGHRAVCLPANAKDLSLSLSSGEP